MTTKIENRTHSFELSTHRSPSGLPVLLHSAQFAAPDRADLAGSLRALQPSLRGRDGLTEADCFVRGSDPISAKLRALGLPANELPRPDGGIRGPCGPRPVNGPAQKPSPYWPGSGKQNVDIDGHGCTFNPKKRDETDPTNPKKHLVDGPLSHNGGYEILDNDPNRFRMTVHIGTDDKQTNDLDVTIDISGGSATVTGSVGGASLGANGVTAPVTGSGTKDDPYSIAFKDSTGGSRSITWVPGR